MKRDIAEPALFETCVIANAEVDASDVTQVRSEASD
jgi:hypothetical protein